MKKLIMMSLMAITILSVACAADDAADEDKKGDVTIDPTKVLVTIANVMAANDTGVSTVSMDRPEAALSTTAVLLTDVTDITLVNTVAWKSPAQRTAIENAITIGGDSETQVEKVVTFTVDSTKKTATFTVSIEANNGFVFADDVKRSFTITLTIVDGGTAPAGLWDDGTVVVDLSAVSLTTVAKVVTTGNTVDVPILNFLNNRTLDADVTLTATGTGTVADVTVAQVVTALNEAMADAIAAYTTITDLEDKITAIATYKAGTFAANGSSAATFDITLTITAMDGYSIATITPVDGTVTAGIVTTSTGQIIEN